MAHMTREELAKMKKSFEVEVKEDSKLLAELAKAAKAAEELKESAKSTKTELSKEGD